MTILGPQTLEQCFSLLLAADGSFVGRVEWCTSNLLQDAASPAAEAGGSGT